MKLVKVLLFSASLGLAFGGFAHADNETVGEKISEGARDAKKNVKQAGRDVKDEACEMINGKMECAGKKIKNKAKTFGDEVKDKTDADAH